jgi:hypothetical protein
MALFARTPLAGKPAPGRTVAVLPPLMVGSQAGAAAVATRAAEAILAGEIAGVRFSGVKETAAKLAKTPAGLETIREQVARELPADVAPKGEAKKLLDTDVVAGVKRERRVVLTLQEAPADRVLGPVSLDPGALTPLGCDYALVSVPFTDFAQWSHIMALYGLVPYAGFSGMGEFAPRGLFVLYDCATEQKVWESHIGSVLVGPRITPDDRALPVVGAAYLLTGDAETPVARLLDNVLRLR